MWFQKLNIRICSGCSSTFNTRSHVFYTVFSLNNNINENIRCWSKYSNGFESNIYFLFREFLFPICRGKIEKEGVKVLKHVKFAKPRFTAKSSILSVNFRTAFSAIACEKHSWLVYIERSSLYSEKSFSFYAFGSNIKISMLKVDLKFFGFEPHGEWVKSLNFVFKL